MLANYHTHTARCGHAAGEDKAYVEAAIEAGMQVLGFSDHCPWVFPDGYESPIRMKLREVDDYFNSLTRLRDAYRDDITIYIGLETEYLPELLEAQDKLLADYPVDYQIMGQHYTKREPDGQYTGRICGDPAVLHEYVNSCIAGMESGRYRYLAHPDLMGFGGAPSVFEREYTRLCTYLKEHDLPVELNVLGLGRHYTSPKFLRIAGACGCKAIIGIDAHQPSALLETAGVSTCLDLAEEAGLELMTFLPGLEAR